MLFLALAIIVIVTVGYLYFIHDPKIMDKLRTMEEDLKK